MCGCFSFSGYVDVGTLHFINGYSLYRSKKKEKKIRVGCGKCMISPNLQVFNTGYAVNAPMF